MVTLLADGADHGDTICGQLEGITAGMLVGFFGGWRRPPSPLRHLRILRGRRHVVLAIDETTDRIVGFVNALTDDCNSAFIPLLEVVPEFRRRGIGSELVARMLDLLRDYPCVDLTCEPELQQFYEGLGMIRSVGMVLRDRDRPGPPERR